VTSETLVSIPNLSGEKSVRILAVMMVTMNDIAWDEDLLSNVNQTACGKNSWI